MARRATIQDLAKRAGVSVSTIDRIMNGRDNVRGGTAEKVLQAAEELEFYALPALRKRLRVEGARLRLGFLLQQSHRTFYRAIAAALREAADAFPDPIEAVVEHLDDLSPESVANHMLRMGESVRALAIVTAEHARVSSAIETLAARGVPTYGLISELSASCGTGYVGLDNWRVGRTAGWAIASLSRRAGKVAILVGNHRCREHAAGFTMLEPLQTFEDTTVAREVTEQLLRREPDLAGIYISGGGMTGALQAITASERSRDIVTVGHELTDHTREGLINGTLSMVLAHPIQRLAQETISQMLRDFAAGSPPGKKVMTFDVFGPENI
jgi:LacI family transcriptional regulator